MDCDDQQLSRLFYELCALFFSILRYPHLFFPSAQVPPPSLQPCAGDRPPQRSQLAPASFVSLLLGASLALLLCGSVTFVLGCILLPWVIGFVMLFYFVGVISSLSSLGKAILCLAVPAPGRISSKESSDSIIDFPTNYLRTRRFCLIPFIIHTVYRSGLILPAATIKTWLRLLFLINLLQQR